MHMRQSGQQVADQQAIRERHVHGYPQNPARDASFFAWLFHVMSEAMFWNGLGQQVLDQRADGDSFAGIPAVNISWLWLLLATWSMQIHVVSHT